jgi:hypothetical protein
MVTNIFHINRNLFFSALIVTTVLKVLKHPFEDKRPQTETEINEHLHKAFKNFYLTVVHLDVLSLPWYVTQTISIEQNSKIYF